MVKEGLEGKGVVASVVEVLEEESVIDLDAVLPHVRSNEVAQINSTGPPLLNSIACV